MGRWGKREKQEEFQITNSKPQINFKSQFQMTKTILQKTEKEIDLPCGGIRIVCLKMRILVIGIYF